MGCGLAVLIITGAAFAPATYIYLRGVDIHRSLPVFVLVRLAQHDNYHAMAELGRRIRSGSVAVTSLTSLIPRALQDARRFPKSIFLSVPLLGGAEAAGLLTRPQQEDYRDALVQIEVEFRGRCRQGETLLVDVRADIPSTGSFGSCTVELGDLEIGNWYLETAWATTIDLADPVPDVSRSFDLDTSVLEVGRHAVKLAVAKRYQNPDFVRSAVWEGELEVLPWHAPDPLKRRADPRLGEALRRIVSFELGTASYGSSRQPELHIRMNEYLPVAVSFDLFARTEKGDVLVGQVVCQRGCRIRWGGYQLDPAEIGATTFAPVLRTNVKHARMSTQDIFEVWDGELVFEPVEFSPREDTQIDSGP